MTVHTLRYLVILVFLLVSKVVLANDNTKAERAGTVLQYLIPSTGYVATYLLDDEEGRDQFYQSFFTNMAITYALKYAINKPRPENNGDYSFPSGHTSQAFQGAAFIHKRYGFTYSIPAYIGASYVGWSRIQSHHHDMSDVIAGAALGILSSYYFTTSYKKMVIMPVLDSHYIGVNLSYQW